MAFSSTATTMDGDLPETRFKQYQLASYAFPTTGTKEVQRPAYVDMDLGCILG